MGPTEAYYVRLVEQECQTLVGGVDLNGHLLADVYFLGGLHTSMAHTFNRTSFFKLDNLADYSIALQRLAKVPAVMDGAVETLKQGIEKGVTYSIESLSRVDKQFERVIVDDPTESEYYAPFEDMDSKGFNDLIAGAIQSRAKAVISNEIMPALTRLRRFIQDEYFHHLRSGPGVSNIANGREFYQKALEYHTTIKGIRPQEVHDIGLEEIGSLTKGVMDVAERLGYGNMTFKEFFTMVQNDPHQHFDDEEELLAHARDIVYNKINPKMSSIIPEEFLTDKLFALEVEPSPPGSGGIARYDAGNEDGTRNGTYRINTRNLGAFKKFEMVSLSLHEGNPGHHFDLTVFRFAFDFPKFLHFHAYGHYGSFPAGTPIYTSFQEGWGLYSEFLGHEMGLYEDPYDLLGFYSWNLLRAARLVVDTGIHAFGWSRQRAIDYLLDNTGLSRVNIETEIDRYITWPGQATAYKIGERAFRRLRKKKEEELGEDFDLRKFHKYLLSCRGPIDMVEECMTLMEEGDQS